MINNFNVTTLDNGLVVCTDEMPGAQSVLVGVWSNIGARFESEADNGLSHFLEHMVFKGTKNFSALDIAHEMDAIGGQMNAYTSYENTAYYTKVLKDDVEKGMEIMADIMCRSTFPEEEVKKEQGVVIQEIGMYKDSPDDLVFDCFQERCFKDQAIGRSILGTQKHVSGFTSADLKRYFDAHYHNNSMYLVVTGAVNHDDICRYARHYFGNDMRRGEKNEYAPSLYTGGIDRIQKDLEQVQMVIGYGGVSYTDDDYYASVVATQILGGGDSSRINQEVRENRGLAYSAYAYQSHFHDTGVLMVYAGTGEEVAGETLSVIRDEYFKMAETVLDDELKRGKAQIKASLLMAAENSYRRADHLGRSMIHFGKPHSIEEIVTGIEAVNASDIKRFMLRCLATKPTITLLGNLNQVPDETGIEKLFKAS